MFMESHKVFRKGFDASGGHAGYLIEFATQIPNGPFIDLHTALHTVFHASFKTHTGLSLILFINF